MSDDIKVTSTKQTALIHLTPEEELTLFGDDPPRWYDHLHAIAHRANLPPAVLIPAPGATSAELLTKRGPHDH